MKRVVLVTGPIGGGKSSVCRHVASKGYPVYDSDSRAKALYREVPGLLERIEKAIGVPYSNFGIIFSDRSKREKLESILYPVVLDDIRKWLESLSSEVTFIESATALGCSLFDGLYSEVWMVDAPLQERIRRNPKAAQRDSLQNFDPARITHIITNDSTLENLYEQTDRLL